MDPARAVLGPLMVGGDGDGDGSGSDGGDASPRRLFSLSFSSLLLLPTLCHFAGPSRR